MYQARTAEPLTFTSPAGFGASAAPFTAPLHYTSYHDDSNSRASTTSPVRNFSVQQRGRSIQEDDTDFGGQSSPTYPRKNSPMKLTEPAQALFVRALYDYDADDHTSLSFRQGDIIQVLNQLETGWWDGVMGNVRGWFPSNYCAVVSNPDEINDLLVARLNDPGDTSNESGVDDDYDDDPADDDVHSEGDPRLSQPILPIEGNTPLEQEEAAFWIPQATPDGRLFYFNTLTGYSTMELPLENPLLPNEAGPRDRSNFFVPDQTRPPAEMMARGVERDEDDYDGSASEGEGESLMFASQDSNLSQRYPSLGDGVSPATSMDSFHPSPSVLKPVPEGIGKTVSAAGIKSAPSRSATAAAAASAPQDATAAVSTIPRQFADDGLVTQVTWSSLVENMKQAVQSYRQALLRGDRSEYVRKAEDISDHLRMLLAAGSDTTDNHSGNPSIISTNRALYPHFRDMMSKFSKLVLSSHIAASDWTGPDSITKCLQEADGVLQGVYGYVEVAQQQRGEDIKRVVPGFVFNSWTGGHWQNNGLRPRESIATSFLDPDGQDLPAEPSIPLDNGVLDQVDTLRKSLIASIRRLEEYLPLTHKVVDSAEHGRLSEGVCVGGLNVIEHYRPWAAVVESINLAPLGSWSQNPQLVDLNLQKQRVYETIADLVISCQAVASPLADEWAELRGDSLEDRLNGVCNLARQLENCISQVSFSLSLLQEQVPGQSLPPSTTTTGKLNEEEEAADPFRKSVSVRTSPSRRKAADSVSPPTTYSFGMEDETEKVRRNMQKAQRFFGQAPPTPASRELTGSDESWFLKFDHEGEVFYDSKADPPTLKCGTLPGLVEQLTRHDKLDASFNNTFLLTYRSFTTAPELFEMLVQRFTIQPPFSLSKDDLQLWTEKKQKPIRFRVVNILKSWFEHYWMEPNDEANMTLLRQVHAFTKDSIATTKTPGSPQLLTVIEQRLRGQDTTMKRMVPTQNTAIPTPILPKNMKKLKFLDIDPTEFARQLTIIESRLYAKIRATECLNKTWQKKVAPGETDPAANVKALILHSNQLTNWVAEMILTQSDVKKRMTVIKHFVNVADRCRVLNNYSTLTSIISALGTAPIHRLSRTWAQVGGRTSAILEQMRKLMASTKNFGEYRETLHHANPPCIPFFGVYLTDLTFIEDGIPSHTQSDLINFNKRVKTAEVIRDIQQYQAAPYQLQAVPELQDYILNNMQAANDVHDMYDRSLEVEPREREDEKIARLLSESGFL